ncbi:hypothetical protein, partial [Shigella flexneri]
FVFIPDLIILPLKWMVMLPTY